MSIWQKSILLLLFIALTACNAIQPENADHNKVGGPGARNYAIVRVFYATDRNLTSSVVPSKMFGVDRSTVSYGACAVSIPRDHRMGELETPSIWRLEFREDPEKHVVLLSVDTQSKDDLFKEIAAKVGQSKRNDAFIFIHGFNVTFEDAARRTAQMSYDLGWNGAAVFYSWPSQGAESPLGYTTDGTNIQWAQADIKQFLDDFLSHSNAHKVYLIAHSMGNQAISGAVLSLIQEKPELTKRISEIILAAPDIDADVFKRDIAPKLVQSGHAVTLYASSTDVALKFSETVNGYPRAGDSGPGIVVVPGVVTVDATNVDTGFIGHSYYGDSRTVLSDLFYLVNEDMPANKRAGLEKISNSIGDYWIFKP